MYVFVIAGQPPLRLNISRQHGAARQTAGQVLAQAGRQIDRPVGHVGHPTDRLDKRSDSHGRGTAQPQAKCMSRRLVFLRASYHLSFKMALLLGV